MATLTATYAHEPPHLPTRVDVAGTREEIMAAAEVVLPRVNAWAAGPRLEASYATGYTDWHVVQTDWTLTFPADRALVQQVRQQVPMQCDDARLLAWLGHA